MNESDQNPNGSFIEESLNSTFTGSRQEKQEPARLMMAKQKNRQLASLHQRTQVFLTKLEKREDRYIESEMNKIDRRIDEFGEEDHQFYRAQSKETLLQMLDLTQAVEAEMYEDLEDLCSLILQSFDRKPAD